MSAVVQNIPEAAQLHIKISDSDDESDGEQQVESKIKMHVRMTPNKYIKKTRVHV